MKTKIISTILILIILFPTISLAQTSGSDLLKGVSSTPNLDKITDPLGLGKTTIPTVPKTEPLPSKLNIGKDFGGDGAQKATLDTAKVPADSLGLKLDTPESRAAAAEREAANKADNDACVEAAELKGLSGVTDCTTYKAALETECKDPSKNLSPTGEQIQYSSCADKAAAEKNLRGQGFKLNLNALTLTSGGQKSGSAIFKNKDYEKYGPLVGTLMRVIDMLIMIIGSLAMLTLILAGIFMITNHGDEAWVTKGKTMMLYSVLGLLAAFLSFAIVNVIQSALA